MGASLTEGSLREEAPLVRSGWDMWPDFYETLREKKKKITRRLRPSMCAIFKFINATVTLP